MINQRHSHTQRVTERKNGCVSKSLIRTSSSYCLLIHLMFEMTARDFLLFLLIFSFVLLFSDSSFPSSSHRQWVEWAQSMTLQMFKQHRWNRMRNGWHSADDYWTRKNHKRLTVNGIDIGTSIGVGMVYIRLMQNISTHISKIICTTDWISIEKK